MKSYPKALQNVSEKEALLIAQKELKLTFSDFDLDSTWYSSWVINGLRQAIAPLVANTLEQSDIPLDPQDLEHQALFYLTTFDPASITEEIIAESVRQQYLIILERLRSCASKDDLAYVFRGLKGRYADLNTWDYWYNWDWLQINLLNTVSAAMVNGSNVPAAAIRFNQNGIDALKSICNGVCTLGMTDGTVTGFGGGYNITTGLITNPNTFSAVPFAAYIAANPSDYEAGIYRGLSAYVQIGRFIRQVIINVTIN